MTLFVFCPANGSDITAALAADNRLRSPPWTGLNKDATKLIVSECLLPEHSFGISPEKTRSDTRVAHIRHWCQVGYLEFHHWSYGGVIREICGERWYAKDKLQGSIMEAWMSRERSLQGVPEQGIRNSPRVTPMRFGSRGPRPALGQQSPFANVILQENSDACCPPDPADQLPRGRPAVHSGKPSWPAPCLAPNTAYARWQWASQVLGEIGGYAADTLLRAVQSLAQMPVRVIKLKL